MRLTPTIYLDSVAVYQSQHCCGNCQGDFCTSQPNLPAALAKPMLTVGLFHSLILKGCVGPPPTQQNIAPSPCNLTWSRCCTVRGGFSLSAWCFRFLGPSTEITAENLCTMHESEANKCVERSFGARALLKDTRLIVNKGFTTLHSVRERVFCVLES